MTDKVLMASYGALDRPLKIGDKEIQCFVLEDGTRVLTQASFLEALGRHRKANVRNEEGLPALLQGKSINPYISQEIIQKSYPIKFRIEKGVVANGYRAEILPAICDIYLNARDAGALPKNQLHVAEQAYILMRGLAHVGIIALVDEATGYQKIRESDALQKILDKYLNDQAHKWAKTFPDSFWQKLVRVKGYPSYIALKRPSFVGHWVNNIVYDRLAPGIKKKLNEVNPRTTKGHRKNKHHQHFTDDYGVPELKEHLSKVMVLMDASANDTEFDRLLNRSLPKYGDTIELPLDTE